MRGRYQVQFELRMSAATSVKNYEYLDILDRGWRSLGMSRPAGGVLCDIGCASFWYAATLHPFLTPAAILAWRLPLALLAPDRLFRQIQHNLRPGGVYFMVNHGLEEAAIAEGLCNAAKLRRIALRSEPGALSRYRRLAPVLSWWRPA